MLALWQAHEQTFTWLKKSPVFRIQQSGSPISISYGFRDIPPSCAHHTMLNRHCACAISRDVYPYVKFKYIFQFLAPTLPIHYVTFIGLHEKRVLSLSGPVMLKAKSGEKFLSQKKFATFWPFRGPGDQGVWKVTTFAAKRTLLRESTSIEPFCVNVRWGVWPPELRSKKVRKSREAPIGMMCRR